MFYKYKSYSYESDNKIICNLCESNLILRKGYKNIQHIVECANTECESFLSRKKSILAFLPPILSEQILSNSKKSKRENNKKCKEYWIKRGYDETCAEEKIRHHQKESSPMCKEYWIKRGYDEVDATIHVSSEAKKRSKGAVLPNNIQYWTKKGFSEEEALKKVSEFQSINSKKNKNWIRPNQVDYWLRKGFSKEDAKIKVSENQAKFSLTKCIEKLGETEGLKRWKERQEKWKLKVFNEDTWIGRGRSKSCDSFLSEILSQLSNSNSNYLFGENEKFIRDSKNSITYKYDFCDTVSKKIVEFNGDFWHGNPNTYKGNEIHPVYKTSIKDQWKFDEQKIKCAINHGYQVLIIWESEFIENKEKTIEKVLKFLKWKKNS